MICAQAGVIEINVADTQADKVPHPELACITIVVTGNHEKPSICNNE